MLLSFMASGLDVRQIVSDIPRDGPAIFIYVITAVSLWLIWLGSRTRDSGDSRPPVATDSGDGGVLWPRAHDSPLEATAGSPAGRRANG